MDLMRPYDEALREILENGVYRTNKRTGIKTISVFGMMKRYRLDTDFFPILTRRKVWPKSVFSELLWFLSGSTNNKDLKELGCNFWSPWVDHEFEKKHGFAEECFGPVYGFQLRHFGGVYGNGAGGFSETRDESPNIYYMNCLVDGEDTAIDLGIATQSTMSALQREPVKGTIVATIYVGESAIGTMCDSSSEEGFHIDRYVQTPDDIANITSASIDYKTGVITLNWDKEPDEHRLRVSYEYDRDKYETGMYGRGGFDQLAWVINRIKEDPSCRRTLWTLWNPQDVDKMRLPPCHMMYQVLVDDDRNLTGILLQRSADYPVGVPANIQFYSALTTMIAQQTGCIAKEFVHMTNDSHIYEDQLDAVKEYLSLPIIDSPRLKINKAADIFSYKPSDFELTEFNPGPKLEIPVAV
jgi:thymidylate synthase